MTRPLFSRFWLTSNIPMQRLRRLLFGLTLSALMVPPLSLGFSLPVLSSDRPSNGLGTTHSEPDFSGTGRPPERRGRQSRGDDACPNPDQEMTALVPQDEGGGWTTMTTPSVWVYVPFALSDHYRAKLIIKTFNVNEKGEVEDIATMRERFSLPPTDAAGIYRFALPLNDEQFSAMPTLSVNGTENNVENTTENTTDFLPGYRWTLEIFCNPEGGRPVVAEGIIRRVEIDPTIDPGWQGDDPERMSQVYADNRVWYDALSVLGEALQADPENAAYGAAWRELLGYSTVGLGAIADEPLVNCCIPLNE